MLLKSIELLQTLPPAARNLFEKRFRYNGLPKAFNYQKFLGVSGGAGSPNLLSEFYCFSFFTTDQ